MLFCCHILWLAHFAEYLNSGADFDLFFKKQDLNRRLRFNPRPTPTLGELKEYTTDKIRRPKTKEKEVSCFSLAEQKKIEQAALSNKKRKFIGIVICLYSGLRIGELLALTWADIDFTKGTLIVSLKPTTAD